MGLINSQQIKVAVLRFLLWEKQYLGAVTEGLGNSDVLGIKKSLFTTEVEIKCTKADFMTEVNSMNHALKKSDSLSNTSKLPKHYHYLDNAVVNNQALPLYEGYAEVYKEKVFRPNEFYFCVPDHLSYLSEVYLQTVSSPYGMLIFNTESNYVYPLRKAIRLHDQKVSTEHLIKILTRSSNENLTLRDKILHMQGG